MIINFNITFSIILGRIINRFTSDIVVMDERLTEDFSDFFDVIKRIFVYQFINENYLFI